VITPVAVEVSMTSNKGQAGDSGTYSTATDYTISIYATGTEPSPSIWNPAAALVAGVI